MKRWAIGTAVIVLALFISANQTAGQGGTPMDFVRAMLDRVLEIQNDPALQQSKDVRRSLIRELIVKSFDFEEMARDSLGQERWNSLSKEQRSEFRTVFQGLFLDSYSRLVLDFLKKEKIDYGKSDVREGKTIVRTSILRLDDRIPVEYVLTDLNAGFLISDVIIDGVSIVQNYRTSFSQVIKKESFSGLLKRMRLQQKAGNQ